jgi:hypothetical protein
VKELKREELKWNIWVEERKNLKFKIDSTKTMSAEKFGKVQKKKEIVSQKE